MEKITILIADDHKLIRETWHFLFSNEPGFEVVAVCGNSAEAVESARLMKPDIILMDIDMTPFSGIEATERIRQESPESKVIGVSMHSHPNYAKRMFQVGAKGYVTKNSSREEMIKAIMDVNKGEKFICEEMKNNISNQLFTEENREPDINSITAREKEIIGYIKQGLSSKEISVKLNISLKTVEVHRHNLLKKLNIKNVASLVNFVNSSPLFK
jgi:DNA-binding NarL/FixJ family response regulator